MLAVGFVGFIGQALTAMGTFGEMRSFEWPAARTSDALPLPDGGYAVPLKHVGRIQLYSEDLTFQYGWHVDAGGGLFTLLPAEEGNLQVFTARGDRHYIFRADGVLLSERRYDRDTETHPQRAPSAVQLHLPSPWWKFPLRGPIHSWALGFAGILLLIVTETREQREAERRRASEYANRPPGPIMRTVNTLLSWFAAAVWAAVGFVWFFSMLGLLVRSIRNANVVGAIVAVPFLLIGCVLLYISLTIVRVALSEIIGWTRKTISALLVK